MNMKSSCFWNQIRNLPASFLHFFLIFPRPVGLRPEPDDPQYKSKRRRWLALLTLVYLLPALVLHGSFVVSEVRGTSLTLISGAPIGNWWTLAAYMLLGLSVLAVKGRQMPTARERRGTALRE